MKLIEIVESFMKSRIWTGLVVLPGLFCFWAAALLANDTAPISGEPPKLLLLKHYNEKQDITGWLMSEKLDGVRAYWDGKYLISRQGKRFAVPAWFTQNFPPFALDGELWLGRGKFSETVAIVNRLEPHDGWRELGYYIFEVPNQSGGFLARLSVLEDYLGRFPAPYLHIIEQVPVRNNDHVKQSLQNVIHSGGEGLVVRNPKVLYAVGRSDQALKVKLKQDAECTVRGYTLGNGKYTGQVGALLCRLTDGEFNQLSADQRIIKIGSGLSDAERKLPPQIGALITFQYSGLTKTGLPRFPVFLRIREDRVD
ncbi:DNA ligase [Thiomicrorhabdus sp. zzn3]|uniref:DNA ligase n=1 Tax=Thiomicrorhabdus sp. zzn3 TaxID=3039775 RepID=UPI002436405D|nr:DNA ligase [Thiomicrorhabdus sp. zzn3]MDG6777392.1 DNA ligase [Thiomicrorhabdus sp. zzn3]